MGSNLIHDIQDPGWQWSGAREYPKEDGDEEIIFFAEEVAHDQNLLSRWEPEGLHCAGGAALPCAVRRCSGVRPVNVPLHGTRAGCSGGASQNPYGHKRTRGSHFHTVPVMYFGPCAGRPRPMSPCAWSRWLVTEIASSTRLPPFMVVTVVPCGSTWRTSWNRRPWIKKALKLNG